jgi:hypothetical protein
VKNLASTSNNCSVQRGEKVTEYMSAPDKNGAPLPRRVGVRSMVPTTWIAHELRVSYLPRSLPKKRGCAVKRHMPR